MFLLPNLPRDWYFKLREFETALEMTQWQLVILGLRVICELGESNPERLRELAAEVKAKHQREGRGARMEGR